MHSIKELLDRAGIPRYRLARRAGISPATLIVWERDGVAPKRRETYERLARVLGVDPKELLEIARDTQGVSDA
jgi:transcriptional regulator with XRE-family HTH domain